ncbi:SMI1/KNR4 family protein [Streptomyces sp. R41]|uniref:SMI1/KNR4 family protein n=1 Tax=Streptomyces sp. R41 TaxID=3238632 RepID=A0AB39R621_9ACTN
MDRWDAEVVRARIHEKAARDPRLAVHGAADHRYELGQRRTEAEVRAFEEAHGIRLPESYRSFLTEIGDGGAGPAHGLLPLLDPVPEEHGDEWASVDERRRDRIPGFLAAPFRFTRHVPIGRVLDSDSSLAGTLTLCEIGCATFYRLVVNGPCTGQVWSHDPDWGGFRPGPDFRDWYTAWLDQP